MPNLYIIYRMVLLSYVVSKWVVVNFGKKLTHEAGGGFPSPSELFEPLDL